MKKVTSTLILLILLSWPNGGYAQGLDAKSFEGSWQGQWVNNTFGSQGDASLDVSVDEAQLTVEFVLDLDGNVLGGSDPDPETFSGTYDAAALTVTGTSVVFGDITWSVDSSGNMTGNGINVPSPTIDSVGFTGTASAQIMTLDYTVYFTGGGTAVGVLTFYKQSTSKILISEFVVTPTEGEFVEIYNPNPDAVDLSDYYLTDATFAGGDTYYYQIVEGGGGGGGFADFHARFPDGALIQPGEYQTIAFPGDSTFFVEYGVMPTYELFEDGFANPADAPDMREAVAGSINMQGGLTNGDEVIILYSWDGFSDLVTDVDYVIYDDAGASPNEAVDKTGVSIDGPDAGTDATQYLDDTPTANQLPAPSPAEGFSTHRIDFTEGAQVSTGGNGVTGADETSEDLNNTFTDNSVPTPNAAYQAAQVFSPSKLLISEFVVTPTEGEFVEIYNPNPDAVDLSDYYLTDATFAGGDTYYYQIVEGGGGGGGFADFHARFPDGALIQPGEYQTIAFPGDSTFFVEYGVMPTYELFEDGFANPADAPDMREAVAGSINMQGGLTNGDEVIILYSWDGFSDLVTDVDYVIYDDAGASPNEAVDKTGVSIDGPDAGTDATQYLDDTPTANQLPAPSPAEGFSTHRIDFTEGAQVSTGGNGVTGADETSEDLNNTFVTDSVITPNGPMQVTSVKEGELVPTEFALLQNFPNPFNPSTVIKFDIARETSVRLVIYDILGKKVRTLIDSEVHQPGSYGIEWDSRNGFGNILSSGTYFYRFEAGDFVSIKKMMLLK